MKSVSTLILSSVAFQNVFGKGTGVIFMRHHSNYPDDVEDPRQLILSTPTNGKNPNPNPSPAIPPAPTDPPTINDYDGKCESTADCSPNSFCEDFTHKNQKTGDEQHTWCVPRYTLNEACHNNHDNNHDTCESDLYCDHEGTGNCMAKKDYNSACTEDHAHECKSGICRWDNLDQVNHWKCGFPETCKKVSDVSGRLSLLPTSECEPHGFCNDQGKCEEKRPNGSNCDHIQQCMSNRCDKLDHCGWACPTGHCVAH